MKLVLFNLFLLILACSCADELNIEQEVVTDPKSPDTIKVSIDTTKIFQTIVGYGGANRMWGTQFLKPAEAQKAFSREADGLGLSLFRVRIPSNVSEWPLIVESCQEAVKYGVKIFASPWSPPASLKSNKSDIGGYLLPENYGAFKDHINAYLSFMKDNGVDIEAVSIQNEPDIMVSYESCDWDVAQMSEFIRIYGDSIVGARIAAPESFNFNENFVNSMLLNPDIVDKFDIVAGHIYGNGQRPFPIATEKGKEIWMTEYLLNLNVGNSGVNWSSLGEAAKWDESLTMLSTVHNAMINNWNAYIWWYLQRFYSFIGDGEQGTINGTILKRGYAFSHYSKFIRPGAKRIEISSDKITPLKITAYDNAGELVVVLINQENYPLKNIQIKVTGMSNATSFTTDLVKNRTSESLPITENKVGFEMKEKSVRTIVFQK